MTAPRRVCSMHAKAYLVTRCVLERRLYLTPSREVKHVFRYALALAAERHGVRILAAFCNTSHYHLVIEDPRDVLPEFEHDLNQTVARALNEEGAIRGGPPPAFRAAPGAPAGHCG